MQNGWNVTGDTYLMDADGYFWYQARSDDMIISAGYNIAGPGGGGRAADASGGRRMRRGRRADEERGQIVKAYVVLRAGHSGDAAMTRALQDHVKATIAPYKYPRAIDFVAALPKTQTGKLQRFELRTIAAEQAARKARILESRTARWRRPKLRSSRPTDDDLPRALLPQGWPRPSGYANGMTAKGRVVVTGGVVGWDVMQNFPTASPHRRARPSRTS